MECPAAPRERTPLGFAGGLVFTDFALDSFYRVCLTLGVITRLAAKLAAIHALCQRIPNLLTSAENCIELNLEPGLDLHSLRRSYATHLIEDGWDALFVQQQMGHDHASSTALYTCVSSDFRIRTLRRALDAAMDAALSDEGRMS